MCVCVELILMKTEKRGFAVYLPWESCLGQGKMSEPLEVRRDGEADGGEEVGANKNGVKQNKEGESNGS